MSLHLPTVVAAASLATWIYLVVARGAFWRVRLRGAGVLQRSLKVTAVVPARNEEDVIERAVKSLVGQAGVSVRVIVVDDNSTDATAERARAAGAEVVHGESLPDGWSGKVWAMQQGLSVALQSNPDYVLFTDADIEHLASNVASLAAIAEEDGNALTSYMVRLHCEKAPEKLLIPAFVFFFFMLCPPKWIANMRTKTAGAAGGCMLVRPSELRRIGGLERIRGEIIDDCSLAREIKKSGQRVWLGLTDSAKSIRPYDTFGEVGRMISRTAFNQLRHSFSVLLGTVIGLLLTYVAPVAVLFSGETPAATMGAAALVLMIAAYIPAVSFYRLGPQWAMTLPLAAIFYMGATVKSAIDYWANRGGQWKGRTQDRAAGATHAK